MHGRLGSLRRSAPQGRVDVRPVIEMGPQWHIRMFRHSHRNAVRSQMKRSWAGWFWTRHVRRKLTLTVIDSNESGAKTTA